MNFFSPITLLIVPLIGSFLIILLNETNYKFNNSKYLDLLSSEKIGYNLSNFQSSKYTKNKIKQIALIASLINLFISILM